MVKSKIRLMLALGVFALFQNKISAVDFGPAESAAGYVAITNPYVTGVNNRILTFGYAKNGFSFNDPATTCSWRSVFPVAGPISLKGGSLYLQSDLILTNTGKFADLGTIYGANHVVELSQYNTTFASGSNPSGKLILNTLSSTTLPVSARSFDWSYDGNYLAIGTAPSTGGLSEVNIYAFSGTTLTLVAGGTLPGHPYVNSVRWHPSSYYLVAATAKLSGSAYYIRAYLFTPSPASLTEISNQAFPTVPYAVAFQGRGNYVVAAGASIRAYSFNAGTLALTSTTTNTLVGTVQYDAIKWAPVGNKNDIIAVTNNGGTTGNLYLYDFTIRGSGGILHLLKTYAQAKAANTIDWCATSTYVAVGFADGTLRTYEHTAATNIIKQRQSYTITGAVNSVNWKYNALELAVARAVAATNEFQIYTFAISDYSLTERYPIALTTDAYCVRYYYNSATASSYIARSDNSTHLLTVYKENYSPFIFRDVNLFLNGDLTLSSPLSFTGNCSINGRNNRITFTGNGSLNLSQNSNLQISLATLKFTTPSAFSLQGGASNLTLKNSEIQLDSDIYLTNGKFDVYDDLTITGPHTFAYQTAYTSTIHSNSTLTLDNGATLQIGKARATTIERLDFENVSSQLNLNNATLHITNSGLKIKKGTVNIFGNSTFNIDWTQSDTADTKVTSTNQGLVFGDGINAGNDPWLILNGNGTRLTILNGAFASDCKSTHSFIQFMGQPQMAFESSPTLYLKSPLAVTDGWFVPDSSTRLIVGPNAYFTVDNTRITGLDVPGDQTVTGTITNATSAVTLMDITLDQNNKYNLISGPSSIILNIIQEGNTISGIGNFVGAINFTNANSGLTWDLPSPIYNNIALNGGRIIFSQDSGIVDGYSFVGTGTIDLTNKTFQLGTDDTTWVGNLYWTGDGATIELHNNVTIDGTWTLSGNIKIKGNNYLIDLAPTGSIILERGAQVEFKDISIYDLSRQNRITCLDNNCTIILNVADLLMTGDYLWDKGSIFVYWNSTIGLIDGLDGMYTFSYESTQTSTIDSFAFLKVLPNTRLSIGRTNSTITNPEAQPLIFIDPLTSKLVLSSGTLHITSSGMIMTKGTLSVEDVSSIEVENTQYPYGLILGDGVLADDFKLDVKGGYNLKITSGTIFYNNNSPNRVVFGSPASSIEVTHDNAFYAKRNIALSNGTLITSGNAVLAIGSDSGIEIQQYDIYRCYNDLPYYSVIKQKVHGINPQILQNGDYFYINEGFSINNVLAESGLSNFGGPGGFGGTLTLKNDTVTVRSALLSQFFSNVDLNGGTFILASDTYFSSDKTFTGSGNVQMNGTRLRLGTLDTNLTHSIYWQGLTSGGIDLGSKISLSGTWTIGGTIEVNGNGNVLDFSNHGVLTIQPNSTLILDDIHIKGLGLGASTIRFMDDTSTLKFSNVNIELDNNLTTTIGGIYIDGSSVIGIKDFDWTFEQKASLTVDGVTLWLDPLDKINHGNIKFGSGSIEKYLSLLSSGTIKTMANLDMLSTETTDLQYQITNNSNAIIKLSLENTLPVNNSNAIVSWIKQTSNTTNWLTMRVRTNSNAFAYGIKNNSNAIIKLDRTERTNSNAFAYGIKNNSNAIIKLDRTERTNSNAFAYGIKNNSNAIIKLDRTARTNSNAFAYGIKNNSNAILSLGGSTTDLSQRITNNSNAIIAQGVTCRTDSNAFAYGIKNNSNAIISLGGATTDLSQRITNNSNAIKYQSEHFISVNDGTLTVLGAINGTTSVEGRGMLSSPIDLQGGTLTLASDMILSNLATVVSSGNFDLQGNAMIFDGNLTFPTNVTIKVVSSGVLDGQSNDLKIASGAKLIVDTGITLTLRNLNWLAAGSPQIEMRSATSKLTLQNSALRFDRDYSFTQGQLFIQDEVFVTGTNKFSYASTGTSYIGSHSALYFDKNTTFSYSPHATARHSQSERNLIKMADMTSEIYFDECALQLPDSGWQLTNGTIYFDNKVTVNGNTTQENSFELGNGLAAGDMNVQLLSGALLDNFGYIYYNPS